MDGGWDIELMFFVYYNVVESKDSWSKPEYWVKGKQTPKK